MPLIQTDKPVYYINTISLQQLSESEIRAAFTNTSFPNPFVPPDGYAYVFPAPQPAHNPVTQAVRETTPVLTAKGHWEQQWEVVPRYTDYTDGDGVLHTADEQMAAEQERIRLAAVPQSVTMRQARLALHAAGLLSGVNAAIASLEEPAKTAAQIEWEYASAVERNAGLVPAMATALGMTERQIDDLFVAAAAL